jgi:hypothetical protein
MTTQPKLRLGIYEGLDAFRAEAPLSRGGTEADFGCHWTEPGQSFPRWRVSWVERTGELYAVRTAGRPFLIVYAVIPDRAQVDRVLAGWADANPRGGMSWVRRRLGAAPAGEEAGLP